MSGGAFDYAYFDAEELQRIVEEMAVFVEQSEVDDRAADRLRRLAEQLDENRDLMRAVEWCASGDFRPEKVAEVMADAE